MRLTTLSKLVCALLLALPAVAQTGTWLPTAPAENGLGGWWELRADGSATYNWGAIAEARYTFDGTILTVIPGGDRKDRPRFQLRFDGDSLYSRVDEPNAPEAQYRRLPALTPIQSAASTRLIGQWASVAVPKAAMADMPGMTGPPHDMPSVRTFTADGIYKVRIVYTTRQGHWRAADNTLTLDGEPDQHFLLKDGTLTISGLAYQQN